jgi:hypothetical protein
MKDEGYEYIRTCNLKVNFCARLRTIFDPKRQEVTALRKLHNEDLVLFKEFCYNDQTQRMRRPGHIVESRAEKCTQSFWQTPQGKSKVKLSHNRPWRLIGL